MVWVSPPLKTPPEAQTRPLGSPFSTHSPLLAQEEAREDRSLSFPLATLRFTDSGVSSRSCPVSTTLPSYHKHRIHILEHAVQDMVQEKLFHADNRVLQRRERCSSNLGEPEREVHPECTVRFPSHKPCCRAFLPIITKN